MTIDEIKLLIIKLDVLLDAEHEKITDAGLQLIFDFTEEKRKQQIKQALEELNKIQKSLQNL